MFEYDVYTIGHNLVPPQFRSGKLYGKTSTPQNTFRIKDGKVSYNAEEYVQKHPDQTFRDFYNLQRRTIVSSAESIFGHITPSTGQMGGQVLKTISKNLFVGHTTIPNPDAILQVFQPQIDSKTGELSRISDKWSTLSDILYGRISDEEAAKYHFYGLDVETFGEIDKAKGIFGITEIGLQERVYKNNPSTLTDIKRVGEIANVERFGSFAIAPSQEQITSLQEDINAFARYGWESLSPMQKVNLRRLSRYNGVFSEVFRFSKGRPIFATSTSSRYYVVNRLSDELIATSAFQGGLNNLISLVTAQSEPDVADSTQVFQEILGWLEKISKEPTSVPFGANSDFDIKALKHALLYTDLGKGIKDSTSYIEGLNKIKDNMLDVVYYIRAAAGMNNVDVQTFMEQMFGSSVGASVDSLIKALMLGGSQSHEAFADLVNEGKILDILGIKFDWAFRRTPQAGQTPQPQAAHTEFSERIKAVLKEIAPSEAGAFDPDKTMFYMRYGALDKTRGYEYAFTPGGSPEKFLEEGRPFQNYTFTNEYWRIDPEYTGVFKVATGENQTTSRYVLSFINAAEEARTRTEYGSASVSPSKATKSPTRIVFSADSLDELTERFSTIVRGSSIFTLGDEAAEGIVTDEDIISQAIFKHLDEGRRALDNFLSPSSVRTVTIHDAQNQSSIVRAHGGIRALQDLYSVMDSLVGEGKLISEDELKNMHGALIDQDTVAKFYDALKDMFGTKGTFDDIAHDFLVGDYQLKSFISIMPTLYEERDVYAYIFKQVAGKFGITTPEGEMPDFSKLTPEQNMQATALAGLLKASVDKEIEQGGIKGISQRKSLKRLGDSFSNLQLSFIDRFGIDIPSPKPSETTSDYIRVAGRTSAEITPGIGKVLSLIDTEAGLEDFTSYLQKKKLLTVEEVIDINSRFGDIVSNDSDRVRRLAMQISQRIVPHRTDLNKEAAEKAAKAKEIAKKLAEEKAAKANAGTKKKAATARKHAAKEAARAAKKSTEDAVEEVEELVNPFIVRSLTQERAAQSYRQFTFQPSIKSKKAQKRFKTKNFSFSEVFNGTLHSDAFPNGTEEIPGILSRISDKNSEFMRILHSFRIDQSNSYNIAEYRGEKIDTFTETLLRRLNLDKGTSDQIAARKKALREIFYAEKYDEKGVQRPYTLANYNEHGIHTILLIPKEGNQSANPNGTTKQGRSALVLYTTDKHIGDVYTYLLNGQHDEELATYTSARRALKDKAAVEELVPFLYRYGVDKYGNALETIAQGEAYEKFIIPTLEVWEDKETGALAASFRTGADLLPTLHRQSSDRAIPAIQQGKYDVASSILRKPYSDTIQFDPTSTKIFPNEQGVRVFSTNDTIRAYEFRPQEGLEKIFRRFVFPYAGAPGASINQFNPAQMLVYQFGQLLDEHIEDSTYGNDFGKYARRIMDTPQWKEFFRRRMMIGAITHETWFFKNSVSWGNRLHDVSSVSYDLTPSLSPGEKGMVTLALSPLDPELKGSLKRPYDFDTSIFDLIKRMSSVTEVYQKIKTTLAGKLGDNGATAVKEFNPSDSIFLTTAAEMLTEWSDYSSTHANQPPLPNMLSLEEFETFIMNRNLLGVPNSNGEKSIPPVLAPNPHQDPKKNPTGKSSIQEALERLPASSAVQGIAPESAVEKGAYYAQPIIDPLTGAIVDYKPIRHGDYSLFSGIKSMMRPVYTQQGNGVGYHPSEISTTISIPKIEEGKKKNTRVDVVDLTTPTAMKIDPNDPTKTLDPNLRKTILSFGTVALESTDFETRQALLTSTENTPRQAIKPETEFYARVRVISDFELQEAYKALLNNTGKKGEIIKAVKEASGALNLELKPENIDELITSVRTTLGSMYQDKALIAPILYRQSFFDQPDYVKLQMRVDNLDTEATIKILKELQDKYTGPKHNHSVTLDRDTIIGRRLNGTDIYWDKTDSLIDYEQLEGIIKTVEAKTEDVDIKVPTTLSDVMDRKIMVGATEKSTVHTVDIEALKEIIKKYIPSQLPNGIIPEEIDAIARNIALTAGTSIISQVSDGAMIMFSPGIAKHGGVLGVESIWNVITEKYIRNNRLDGRDGLVAMLNKFGVQNGYFAEGVKEEFAVETLEGKPRLISNIGHIDRQAQFVEAFYDKLVKDVEAASPTDQDLAIKKAIIAEVQDLQQTNSILATVHAQNMNEHMGTRLVADRRIMQSIQLRSLYERPDGQMHYFDFTDGTKRVRSDPNFKWAEILKQRSLDYNGRGKGLSDNQHGTIVYSELDKAASRLSASKNYSRIRLNHDHRDIARAITGIAQVLDYMDAPDHMGYIGDIRDKNIIEISLSDITNPTIVNPDNLYESIFFKDGKPSQWLRNQAARHQKRIDDGKAYSILITIPKEVGRTEAPAGSNLVTMQYDQQQWPGFLIPIVSGNVDRDRVYYQATSSDVADFIREIQHVTQASKNPATDDFLTAIMKYYTGGLKQKFTEDIRLLKKSSNLFKITQQFTIPNSGEFLAQDEASPILAKIFDQDTDLKNALAARDAIAKKFASNPEAAYDSSTIEQYAKAQETIKQQLKIIADKVRNSDGLEGDELEIFSTIVPDSPLGKAAIHTAANGKKYRGVAVAVSRTGFERMGFNFGYISQQIAKDYARGLKGERTHFEGIGPKAIQANAGYQGLNDTIKTALAKIYDTSSSESLVDSLPSSWARAMFSEELMASKGATGPSDISAHRKSDAGKLVQGFLEKARHDLFANDGHGGLLRKVFPEDVKPPWQSSQELIQTLLESKAYNPSEKRPYLDVVPHFSDMFKFDSDSDVGVLRTESYMKEIRSYTEDLLKFLRNSDVKFSDDSPLQTLREQLLQISDSDEISKEISERASKILAEMYKTINDAFSTSGIADTYLSEVGTFGELVRYPVFRSQALVRIILDNSVSGAQVRIGNPVLSSITNLDFDGDKIFLALLSEGMGIIESTDDAYKTARKVYENFLKYNEPLLLAELLESGEGLNVDIPNAINKQKGKLLEIVHADDFEKAQLAYLTKLKKDHADDIFSKYFDTELSPEEALKVLNENKNSVKFSGLIEGMFASQEMGAAFNKFGNTMVNEYGEIAALVARIRKNQIGNFSTPGFRLREALLENILTTDSAQTKQLLQDLLHGLTDIGGKSSGILDIAEQVSIDVKHARDGLMLLMASDFSEGIRDLFKAANLSTSGREKSEQEAVMKMMNALGPKVFGGMDFTTNAKDIETARTLLFGLSTDTLDGSKILAQHIAYRKGLKTGVESKEITQLGKISEDQEMLSKFLTIRRLHQVVHDNQEVRDSYERLSNHGYEAIAEYLKTYKSLSARERKAIFKSLEEDGKMAGAMNREVYEILTQGPEDIVTLHNDELYFTLTFNKDIRDAIKSGDPSSVSDTALAQPFDVRYWASSDGVIHRLNGPGLLKQPSPDPISGEPRALWSSLGTVSEEKAEELKRFLKTTPKDSPVEVGKLIQGNSDAESIVQRAIQSEAIQTFLNEAAIDTETHGLKSRFEFILDPDRYRDAIESHAPKNTPREVAPGIEKAAQILTRLFPTDTVGDAEKLQQYKNAILYSTIMQGSLSQTSGADLIRAVNKSIAEKAQEQHKAGGLDSVESIEQSILSEYYARIQDAYFDGDKGKFDDAIIKGTKFFDDFQVLSPESLQTYVRSIASIRNASYNIPEEVTIIDDADRSLRTLLQDPVALLSKDERSALLAYAKDEKKMREVTSQLYEGTIAAIQEDEDTIYRLFGLVNGSTVARHNLSYAFGWTINGWTFDRIKNEVGVDNLSENQRRLLSKASGDALVGFGPYMGRTINSLTRGEAATVQELFKFIQNPTLKGEPITPSNGKSAISALREDSSIYEYAVQQTQFALDHYLLSVEGGLDGLPSDEKATQTFGSVYLQGREYADTLKGITLQSRSNAKRRAIHSQQTSGASTATNSKGTVSTGPQRKTLHGAAYDYASNLGITKTQVGIGLAGLAALGIVNKFLHEDHSRPPLQAGRSGASQPPMPNGEFSTGTQVAPYFPGSQRTVYHDKSSGLSFRVHANTARQISAINAQRAFNRAGVDNALMYTYNDTSRVSDNWLANKFAELSE